MAIWLFGNLYIDILISASTAKFYFSLTKSYWKSKTFTYDHYNSCTHLFGTSITLLQLLISLKKRLLELLEHPSITSIFKEIVLMKILGNFPVKHSFWNPLFKYICRLESFNRGAGKGWLLKCFFFFSNHKIYNIKNICVYSKSKIKTKVTNKQNSWPIFIRALVFSFSRRANFSSLKYLSFSFLLIFRVILI